MTQEERIKALIVEADLSDVALSGNFLKWLQGNSFFTSPASAKYHGVYEGALFDHSFSVYEKLKDFTEKNNLKWQRPQSPFIVGMFHDICKCDLYTPIVETKYAEKDGQKMVAVDVITGYEYNEDVMLEGHGSKSVMLLSQFMTLTEEEMLCIRFHMGAYEKDDWKMLDKAIKKYPNVMWTHHADMLASKLNV